MPLLGHLWRGLATKDVLARLVRALLEQAIDGGGLLALADGAAFDGEELRDQGLQRTPPLSSRGPRAGAARGRLEARPRKARHLRASSTTAARYVIGLLNLLHRLLRRADSRGVALRDALQAVARRGRTGRAAARNAEASGK